MEGVIGIRREDKSEWERRVPLTPEHVRLLAGKGLRVIVQPSAIRVFADEEYARAGAEIREDLSGCGTIFAVKEIPIPLLEEGKTYVFFAHVIKGQRKNMPMLRRLIDLACTLIDYEVVTDERGRRLIFFGVHAGYAGMIDTFEALGRRLAAEGVDTPFATVRMAHDYTSLERAKDRIREIGAAIARDGLPPELSPLVVGFAGYGNVSRGAQEVFDCLPFEEMTPGELLTVDLDSLSNRKAYKVVFKEEHLVEPADPGGVFELQDYYEHPEKYAGVFRRYLPRLSVLVNCTYWDDRYPRLVTRQDCRDLYAAERPRLRVIGDISCDIEGSIECTLEATQPDHPTYVYLPGEDRIVAGVRGHGPVIMAIDNLPCELPREASETFSEALSPYVEAIARADTSRPIEAGGLPPEIQRAVILIRGALTPSFIHLQKHLSGKETAR